MAKKGVEREKLWTKKKVQKKGIEEKRIFRILKLMSEIIKERTRVDYVLEQGLTDDGFWHYRKWHSGLAECWTRVGYGSNALTSNKAAGVYSNDTWAAKNIKFPPSFFVSTPVAIINADTNGYTHSQIAACTTSDLAIRVWSSYPSTVSTLHISIYARGKWK